MTILGLLGILSLGNYGAAAGKLSWDHSGASRQKMQTTERKVGKRNRSVTMRSYPRAIGRMILAEGPCPIIDDLSCCTYSARRETEAYWLGW